MGILKILPLSLLELCHTLAQNLQCLPSTLEFRLARSFKIWHLQLSLASSSQQVSCSFSCLPLHALFLQLEGLPSFLLSVVLQSPLSFPTLIPLSLPRVDCSLSGKSPGL